MRRILQLSNVQKYYGNERNVVKALDKINLSVFEGEFVAIMGPSGSGKTTLLNMIALLDEVTSGEIFIEEQEATLLNAKKTDQFRAKKLGFIFQEFNLIESLNGYDNIALSMSLIGKTDFDMKIKSVAKTLKIKDILNNFPHELSGGQKQRIAVARALVKNPALILCDEPTGALDSKNSENLLKYLEEINKKNNTIIMVTHDTLAASYANSVVFLKDGKIFSKVSRVNNMTNSEFRDIIAKNEVFMRGPND